MAGVGAGRRRGWFALGSILLLALVTTKVEAAGRDLEDGSPCDAPAPVKYEQLSDDVVKELEAWMLMPADLRGNFWRKDGGFPKLYLLLNPPPPPPGAVPRVIPKGIRENRPAYAVCKNYFGSICPGGQSPMPSPTVDDIIKGEKQLNEVDSDCSPPSVCPSPPAKTGNCKSGKCQFVMEKTYQFVCGQESGGAKLKKLNETHYTQNQFEDGKLCHPMDPRRGLDYDSDKQNGGVQLRLAEVFQKLPEKAKKQIEVSYSHHCKTGSCRYFEDKKSFVCTGNAVRPYWVIILIGVLVGYVQSSN